MMIAIYVLALLLFGSTWVAVKFGLQSTEPFTAAVLRFVIAFAVLGAVFRTWRYRLPSLPKLRRSLLISGFLMYGLNFFFIYLGQQWISASLAAILFATMPFFTALFAHYLLPDEKLTWRVIVGMVVGFGGTIALFSQDLALGGPVYGMASMLLASAFCSWASVLIKRDLGAVDPIQLSILMILPGLALLVPSMLLLEWPLKLEIERAGWLSLLYLALMGTGVAFILWYYLLKRISVVALSLMTFLEPLVAITLGYLLLNERLTSHFLIGGILILAGVLLATLQPRQSEEPSL
ncbi:MAG: EamA family transporter [candidate division Zixibacteria bacterium]|nr:EamA family transporter [candidate division Zixibacteria bacterium]